MTPPFRPVVLLFCYGLLSGCLPSGAAAPVRTANSDAGTVTISDSAAGQVLRLTPSHLTFSAGGRRLWSRGVPAPDFRFQDAVTLPGLVVVALQKSDATSILVLGLDAASGRERWRFSDDSCGEPTLGAVSGAPDLLSLSQSCDGAMLSSRLTLLDARTGRVRLTGQNVQPVRAAGGAVLLSYQDFIMTFEAATSFYAESTGYERLELFSGRVRPFLKRARPGCGPLDLTALNAAQSSDDLARSTRPQGKFLLSHLQDRCGKFTARFDWTDLKNPAPVILPGWR